MVRLALYTSAICTCLVVPSAGAATASLREVRADGKTLLEIENAFVHLKIDPTAGGRIVGFRLTPAKHDMVAGRGPKWGFFADMFSQQAWPGELQRQPYKVDVLQRGPQRVSVRLTRVATGRSGGYAPAVDGIRVEKTYTVTADSPSLRVHYRLVNTTGRGRAPAFWVQSIFAPGPDKRDTVYFRPSSRGVDVTRYDVESGNRVRRDDVRDPAGAWMATLDPKTKTGLVFLLDYAYLRWPYNCQPGFTTEWFYDKVMIPGGRSWETEVVCVPVTDLTNVAYASHKLIVGVTRHRKRMTFAVRAVEGRLASLTMAVAVKSVDNQPLVGTRTLTWTGLTATPQRQTLALPVAIDPAECVIPFSLKGKDIDTRGEIAYSDRDLTVALLGGLGEETLYRVPVPPKHKRFLKPTKIERRPSTPPRALVLAGVYHRHYQVSAAVGLLGWDEVTGKASVAQWSGHALTLWPEDYARMMAYDVVVLVNVDPRAIGAEGLEMLREFVHHGGGLLVLGGPFAFSPDGFRGTCLEDMLPIQYAGRAALTPLADGRLRPVKRGALAVGLDLTDTPTCFWSHDLRPKPAAEVALYAGKRALLVFGSYGRGRTAVFLGSPLGAGPKGRTPFWKCTSWPTYLSRVLQRLAGGADRAAPE